MIYPGRDFEKASCRDAAIDKFLLVDMFDKIEELNLNIHSMVLLRDGAKIFDVYADGFNPTSREEVYSISKSFTSIAIGICLDQGLFALDQSVLSFFRHELSSYNPDYEKVTIRHLLTMTVGHSQDYLFEHMNHSSVVQRFFELPLDFEPGTQFVYNNYASYLLSAIVQKTTHKNLNDFLDDMLYKKIGIVKPVWDEIEHISTGAWGLKLGVLDLARFGHFLLNEGLWKEEQIVSRSFIREATTFQVSTTHVENPKDRYGYGYQFWINDFGDYRAAGLYKQYIVVNKEFNAVFAVQAYEERELLDLFTSYIQSGFMRGWQYTYHSLRDYLYRFHQNSQARIEQEHKQRT